MTDAPSLLVLADSVEARKAGPLALAVILVLCVACYFLFRSMSRHLRRVRENFPAENGSDPSLTEGADRQAGPPSAADRPDGPPVDSAS